MWVRAGLALVGSALACTACAGASAAQHPATSPHTAAVRRDSAPTAAAIRKAVAWRIPARPHGRGAYLMARVPRTLHTRFGAVKPKTQFGQPVWVPVVRYHGVRGALLVPLGPSGRIVRVNLRRMPLRWTRTRVVVNLALSRISVLRGRRRLGAFPIGQGTPETPTPVGRFFVTDRLIFPPGSPYTPFAFGLSARQTHLAPTWIGGNQIAIHPGPLGHVSNGCIHVPLGAIALLRKVAPLGTLVIVRRG
jgi:L,D-transpeptidase catalytic domain